MDGIAAARKKNLAGQFDLFGGMEQDKHAGEVPLPNLPEFTKAELLNMGKETTGLYLSGHPMDAYREPDSAGSGQQDGAITGDFAQETGPEPFTTTRRCVWRGWSLPPRPRPPGTTP